MKTIQKHLLNMGNSGHYICEHSLVYYELGTTDAPDLHLLEKQTLWTLPLI